MSYYGLATFCGAYFLAVAIPGPGVAARSENDQNYQRGSGSLMAVAALAVATR
jgi:hypothetical protein